MSYLQPQRPTNSSERFRLSAMILIGCFVAMVGCGEPTGPRTICCTPKPEQPEQIVSGLAVLAAELHDAADVFAHGVEGTALRGQAESAVNSLADQLLAGKVAASRSALFEARLLLASLDDTSAIELTPVGLALDHVERRMNQILLSGA
jgi:hypothetical protein